TAAPPSLANGRIRQAPSHCVIMSSLDPPQSLPRRARQHRSHSPTRLPRPAYSLRPPCQGIKVKSLWLAEGRLRPWIIAQDRRFIGVLGLRGRGGAAIRSALQRPPIVFWGNGKFPYRGEARQGHRAAGQDPPNRWRHTVAARRGGSREVGVFARAVVAAAVYDTIKQQRSRTGDEGVVTVGPDRGKRVRCVGERRRRVSGTWPADTVANGFAGFGIAGHAGCRRFSYFPALGHCGDLRRRARAPSYLHHALQCARQSDAVAYHSQHADRNYLDHRSGHHPGVNRSAVVPAVVRPDSSAYTRPDRELPANNGSGATAIRTTAI